MREIIDLAEKSTDAQLEAQLEASQPWPFEGKTVKLAGGMDPVAEGHVNVGTITIFMPDETAQRAGFTPYKLENETPVDATQTVLTEFFGRYIPFVPKGS